MQVEAESRGTGTDANAIQISRAGVATALVGVPLRYMHSPSEVISLADADAMVDRLLDSVDPHSTALDGERAAGIGS